MWRFVDLCGNQLPISIKTINNFSEICISQETPSLFPLLKRENWVPLLSRFLLRGRGGCTQAMLYSQLPTLEIKVSKLPFWNKKRLALCLTGAFPQYTIKVKKPLLLEQNHKEKSKGAYMGYSWINFFKNESW